MVEIQKGIYRYGEPLLESTLETLVVVHPYYAEGRQIAVKQKDSNENYCQARDRILDSWKNKGNVVVFEMDNKYWFDDFAKKIIPNFERGLYLIPTEYFGTGATANPNRTNWEGVASFLKSLNKEILFMGGLYFDRTIGSGKSKEYFAQPFGGCLGGAITQLERKGVFGKIIEEACFCKTQDLN